MIALLKKIVGWLPDFIKADFLRKIIALGLASLVWISVVNKIGVMSKIARVPVILSVPKNLILMDEEPPRVTLKIVASEKRLKQLYPTNFIIRKQIDEKRFVPGEPYELSITSEEIKAPVGVNVVEVEPNSVFVNLDKVVSRVVKVKPKINGAPPSGYTVTKVSLAPNEVTMTGPDNLVGGIEQIQTKSITLDKTTVESFDFPISLQNKYESITITPPRVMAQVEIRKEFEERKINMIPIRVLEPSGEAPLSVIPLSTPHVEVTLAGLKSVVENVKPDQIKAFVDLSPFDKPGSYNVPVNCWLTISNATVKKVSPSEVMISLAKPGVESKGDDPKKKKQANKQN